MLWFLGVGREQLTPRARLRVGVALPGWHMRLWGGDPAHETGLWYRVSAKGGGREEGQLTGALGDGKQSSGHCTHGVEGGQQEVCGG